MRFLRPAIILVLVTGLLWTGWFWAYKTASMGWESGTRRPVLRVMGMNVTYNEKNGRRFSTIFKPLIQREYEKSAAILTEGTFRGIGYNNEGRTGMSINRPGKMGISIKFGPEYEEVLKNLEPDTPVKVWYKQRPIPEKPFNYDYFLTDLVVEK